jgi:hypothetical protein
LQQRLQIQQCFTTDCGHRRQVHSAAGRRIKHPLRDLQESSFEVFFDAAAEQGAPISGEGLVDLHNAVVPRMPGVTDFSRFNTMGVALSTCTTKTGLILGWGRTRPQAELQRLRAQTKSSPCHELADCTTATRSPPKSLRLVNHLPGLTCAGFQGESRLPNPIPACPIAADASRDYVAELN